MSQWRVLFEQNYWGSHYIDYYGEESASEQKSEKAMPEAECPACEDGQENKLSMLTEEHRVNQIVTWYGETWKLLSIYTCSEGFVLDYCKKIDPAELQAFTNRFQEAGFEDKFDEELFERIQLDNPTAPGVHIEIFRDKKMLSSEGRSSLTYVPKGVEGQENDPIALLCMAHYGLDTRYAWHFNRAHYFWDEGHKEDLSGLTAVFDEMEIDVPGERFHLTGEPQKIPLTHAVSGEHFHLCIEGVEAGELEREILSRMDQETEIVYPTHYEAISYYTDPELPQDSYFLKARSKGDSPIVKETSTKAACAISVIGGSSGPTSIFIAGKKGKHTSDKKCLLSALFKPTPVRDWYICYRYKRREPLSVALSVSVAYD